MGKKKIAFDLAEGIFDRTFFLSASWTGLTNDTLAFPEGKIAFRNYANIIDFFWQVVNHADQSYSADDNKNFLQSLMSRAKHRIATTGAKRKASRGKNRPRAIQKYKKRAKQTPVPEVQANENPAIENDTEIRENLDGDASEDELGSEKAEGDDDLLEGMNDDQENDAE